MGNHNQGHWPGFCLIGLVMGLLVTVIPQPARAQEAVESEAPGEAETTQVNSSTEDGESQAQEEAAGDPRGDGRETEAAGTAAAAEDGPQDETPAPTEGMPEEGAPVDESPANVPASDPAEATDTTSDNATDADEFYEPGGDEIDTGDPLEGMNRVFFKFNDFLDKLVLKPAAQLYRFILPNYVEDRIRNVVNNADSPVILANDILQWKWDRAWDTTSRFFINTTLGVGGIWDVASSFGIERHDEDFGQTLCVWGAKEWIYLYLPFVGPTSPRDLTGKVVDRYFDPLTYYGDIVQQINLSNGVTIRWNIDNAGWAQIGLASADLIDMRARNIETINEIERTSIDFYTAVRSLYRQSRDNACNDGKVDFEELPDLSEEFE